MASLFHDTSIVSFSGMNLSNNLGRSDANSRKVLHRRCHWISCIVDEYIDIAVCFLYLQHNASDPVEPPRVVELNYIAASSLNFCDGIARLAPTSNTTDHCVARVECGEANGSAEAAGATGNEPERCHSSRIPVLFLSDRSKHERTYSLRSAQRHTVSYGHNLGGFGWSIFHAGKAFPFCIHTQLAQE
jgi:hypothetical protein